MIKLTIIGSCVLLGSSVFLSFNVLVMHQFKLLFLKQFRIFQTSELYYNSID
jgi:hypothetical protein